MKRVLSLIMILAMVLAMVPAVFAEETTYAAATLTYDWMTDSYVETPYATFEEAYAADGDIVKLLADLNYEGTFVHSNYKTLDLNGYNLISNGFVAFSGSSVVDDSTDKTGRLMPGYYKPVLGASNAQMPIYVGYVNGEDAYMLASVDMSLQMVNEWTASKLDYISLPKLGSTVIDGSKQEVGAYFSDSDLETLIRMTWTTNNGATVTQDYVFPADMAITAYTTDAFGLVATNLSKVSDVTISTVVRSASTGFEKQSDVLSAPGSMSNPYTLADAATITIPAGKTVYYNASEFNGKILALTKSGDVDDSNVTVYTGNSWMPSSCSADESVLINGTVWIENLGTDDVTYTTAITSAPGSTKEDAAETIIATGMGMTNKGTSIGTEGYWTKWEATGSGTFTVDVVPGSMFGGTQCFWAIKIINETTGAETEPLESGTYDEYGYEKTALSVNVSEGDVIYVNIVNVDGYEASVEFAATFTANSYYMPSPITTGINYANVAEDGGMYYFLPWTAPSAGTVTVSVVNEVTQPDWGAGKTTAEGWLIAVDDLVVENGVETQTIEVAEGEEIEISVLVETAGKVAFILKFEEASAAE